MNRRQDSLARQQTLIPPVQSNPERGQASGEQRGVAGKQRKGLRRQAKSADDGCRRRETFRDGDNAWKFVLHFGTPKSSGFEPPNRCSERPLWVWGLQENN